MPSRGTGAGALAALLLSAVLGPGCAAARHDRALVPDLAALTAGVGWTVQNRRAQLVAGGDGSAAVRLDEGASEGAAWLEGFEFSEGAIEVDLRGRDVLQGSFVGIAFHGVDELMYDAVYFRPFNFRATDAVRRSHSVQYVSHPTYTWQALREQCPGRFEQALHPVPDPTEWFHVRVEVAAMRVRVFVDGASRPSLSVQQLSRRGRGRVGLFVGDNSGGDFANLRIEPLQPGARADRSAAVAEHSAKGRQR